MELEHEVMSVPIRSLVDGNHLGGLSEEYGVYFLSFQIQGRIPLGLSLWKQHAMLFYALLPPLLITPCVLAL